MLGWFADEADPDAGLLSFRRVSDELGSTHWYLKMLRDEGRAADRLAHALARSRYAADLLARSPESVSILGDPNGLTPRTVRRSRRRCSRRPGGATPSPRRSPPCARSAGTSCCASSWPTWWGPSTSRGVGAALTDLTAATIEVALEAATTTWSAREDVPDRR